MKKLLLFLLLLTNNFAFSQPPNDEPCGAITIPVASTGCEPAIIYSYTGATFSTAVGAPGCVNQNTKDVFYKVTVPASGSITVAVASANTSSMAVEMMNSTSCSSLSAFTSNNGFHCLYGDNNDKITYRNLTPGNTVYLRVYYWTNVTVGTGDIKICVSNPVALADDPCDAGFIDVETADPLGQYCMPSRIFNYTGASLTPAIPNPSCINPLYYSNIRDVWFKVRVPATGKINMATAPGEANPLNPFLIVSYTTSSCNGSFTEINCTGYIGGFSYATVLTGLVPNSILYCRVIATSTQPFPNGSVKICVAGHNELPAVNNNSKIGIGIDSPFAKLDVVGSSIFRDKITAGTDVEIRGNLLVQGSIVGKYGITNLTSPVNLSGKLLLDSMDFTNRLGNHISLYGGLGTASQYGFGVQAGRLQIYSDAPGSNIVFGSGNSYVFTERARIINQGEFGMSLKGRLQLQTGTQSAGLWLNNIANSSSPAFIGMAADNLVGLYGSGGAGWGLTMNTANANVGIGINGASPARPLSFPASLGEKILLYPGGVGEVGIGVYGGELRLHCDIPGGKVSFGTQDNAGVFDNTALAQRNGAFAFSVLGNIWANGTTYTSDERFKKNITAISSPLQKLLQLNGVEYEMKSDEFPDSHFQPGRQIGLLAQNVEKVIPEAVNEKDGYKGVDYARLVPLLIEAMKEMQKQIDELKSKK